MGLNHDHRMRVQRDDCALVECDCAMMEAIGGLLGLLPEKNGVVVGQYHPDRKQRCRSRVCITPVSSLRGRLPLISASDTGIIPHSLSIHGRTDACYPGGECDKMGKPGTESALFYIKFWAMAFPSDHLVDSKSK